MSERADPFEDEPIGNVVDAEASAPDAQQKLSPQGSVKPWIWLLMLGLGLLLIDFLILPVFDGAFSGPFQVWPIYVVVGWIYSQAFLAIILSALIGRVWLNGIAIGVVFTAISMSAIMLSQELVVGTTFFAGPVDKPFAWSFFALPALLMICGSPLLLMRWIRGWRLTLHHPITPRGAFGIEELLLSTASIASLIAISQLSAAGFEVPISSMLTSFLFAGGIVGLITLLIGIPLVWAVYRLRNFWAKLGITIVLGACMVLTFFVIGMLSESSDAIPLILITVSLLLGTLFCFLIIIKRLGFQLAKYAPRQAGTVALDDKPRDQRRNRYSVAIAVGCAITCAGASSLMEGNTRFREAEFERINANLLERGGQIQLRQGKLDKVQLGEDSSTSEILLLPAYSNIRSLTLNGNSFNDQSLDLLTSLPDLEELDLSDTPVTDEAFDTLGKCDKLTSINLARTKVTVSGLLSFLRTRGNISRLDISGLNITDDDIQLNDGLGNINQLILRDNKITEIGASKLLNRKNSYGNTIDLSNNPINFNGVQIAGMMSSLTLENLSIDDKQFATLFLNGQSNVSSLTLSNTKLSNATLTQLMTTLSINQLTVGDGNFTDDGFAKIDVPVSLSNLHIKGKQFTGSFLATWVPQFINTLSFAHSAVQGVYFKHLVKPDFTIYHLDLSHCPQLTDGDLLLLNGANINSLSIIDTPFTCNGLLQLALANQSCEVYTAFGQFTGDEISLLRRKYTVHVGEKPEYGY